ncbi:MAG: hypothetical protein HWD61_09195 [Parachlamydiaceae bacterium]|nr:MAG: hypothetical protein HWD61_09195 [Parachlamydiaceae bacterium]
MPTYIHNTHKTQNTLNAFTDAVYVPNCRCNLIRPYSKALENFHIAFSKEKYAKIENLFEKIGTILMRQITTGMYLNPFREV